MVDIGLLLSIYTHQLCSALHLVSQLSRRRRTLSRRRSVKSLGILLLRRGRAVALSWGRVALGDLGAHRILVVGGPWRV